MISYIRSDKFSVLKPHNVELFLLFVSSFGVESMCGC